MTKHTGSLHNIALGLFWVSVGFLGTQVIWLIYRGALSVYAGD